MAFGNEIRAGSSGAQATDFYNEAITASLRFPADSGGGYLSRTFDHNNTSNDRSSSRCSKNKNSNINNTNSNTNSISHNSKSKKQSNQ